MAGKSGREISIASNKTVLHKVLSWEGALVLTFIAVNILGVILSENYTAANVLRQMPRYLAEIFILFPMGFILILADIDISVGSIVCLSATMACFAGNAGLPFPVVILVCLLAGLICGAVNGAILAKFTELPSMIVTLGTQIIFRGIAEVSMGSGGTISYTNSADLIPLTTMVGPFPISFFGVVIAAVIFIVLLSKTTFGRKLYAIGSNKTAAYYAGIKVEKIRFIVFSLAGLMSGVCALVLLSVLFSANTTTGQGFEMEAIEAAGAECIVSYPEQATADAQITVLQSLISQGVDSISVAANDENALQATLQQAMDAGIKVSCFDSKTNADSRQVFVNQADTNLIGQTLMDAVYDITGGEGQWAILSATSQAANQNAWIEAMQAVMEGDEKYANLELVDIVYGDDEPQPSTEQTQALLQNYPDLKLICAPTTVGINAAAKVLQDQGSDVKITGLGMPSEMEAYVGEDNVCPYFYLWNPIDLGELAAHTAMAVQRSSLASRSNSILKTLQSGLTYSKPYRNKAFPLS